MTLDKKVLFLLPYPLHRAPSQRFRVEAFFMELDKAGIAYQTDQFLDEKAWRILYQQGSVMQKGWSVFMGYLKRLLVVLFKAPLFDYVFIHREAAPLGPPIFEWILKNIFRKRLIFDFDDAIWIPNVSESNQLARSVKCFWKIKYICKWSYKIAAGNQYLANYALQFNKAVVILPTNVDTENRYNMIKQQEVDKPVIGWTGSQSTLKYLDIIYPILKELESQYDFTFLVICNEKPSFTLSSLQFTPWKESSEIEDLLQMNIGIMPLENDPWSEGKCGFKIIQYLSLGIPAVASPVGVNKAIIKDGQNGYLCTTKEEWYQSLLGLLEDSAKRTQMGSMGRLDIEEGYSISANKSKFLSFFH